jgi:Cu(I)/Ag(I) efflux system membrane fusion protein
MADSTIEKIEKSGKAPKHVSVYSTATGTVIEKHFDQGAYVKAGTPLLHVADLTAVWVQVDAYETDLPNIALGQSVALSVRSLPGEVFTGEVAFIDPVVDPRTRTVKVRVEVDNEDGRLRPGMFAEALIETGLDAGTRIVVPASAVLFTGRRSVVYVEVPDQDVPTYEIREIALGPRAGSYYAVSSGLAEGERVVVEGAFALDADLQLRGGDSMMSRPGQEAVEAVALEIPEAFATAMRPVLERYLDIHEALASDEHEKAQDNLRGLVEEVEKIEAEGSRDARETWSTLSQGLADQARKGADADDIAATRAAFEHVSAKVQRMLSVFGNPSEVPVALAHCPMAFKGRGANWVQRGTTIANPYFGSAMHRCGDIEATVKPGEHLVVAASSKAEPTHEHSEHADHSH